MVEMLGVLVIIGVLSVVGVIGYQYAVTQNKANRVMNDVRLAYVNVNSSQNLQLNQLEPVTFTPASGYQMFTQRVAVQENMTDVVIVKNVEQDVCNHLTDMVQTTKWQLFWIDTLTNRFTRLTECTDDISLAFSMDDIRRSIFTCQKECPENMMCNINNECVCADGYTMGKDGKCQQIVCDYSGGIEAQTIQYCCTKVGGVWNYDASPEVCECPENYFFNGKRCALDNWCSYELNVPENVSTFQADCAYELNVPEIVRTFQSDCAYELKVPEIVRTFQSDCAYTLEVSDITNKLTPISGKTCKSGQYCRLHWSDETCVAGAGSYGANTTTTLYGRCSAYDEYLNYCPNVTSGKLSLTPISGKTCGSGQYCRLHWSNETCSAGAGNYEANTTTTLYGRCSAYDEYLNYCPRLSGDPITLTPTHACSDENTYCSVFWGSKSCENVGSYGGGTQRELVGVCLPYDDTNKMMCPFQ